MQAAASLLERVSIHFTQTICAGWQRAPAPWGSGWLGLRVRARGAGRAPSSSVGVRPNWGASLSRMFSNCPSWKCRGMLVSLAF